jgi:hypothetical protein
LLLLAILSLAGEISKSTADGKPVGPDRVWPGGLAMSRTIGDPQAHQVGAAAAFVACYKQLDT